MYDALFEEISPETRGLGEIILLMGWICVSRFYYLLFAIGIASTLYIYELLDVYLQHKYEKELKEFEQKLQILEHVKVQ